MGLDPNLLNSLPDNLVDMYGLVEIDILEDMARRISTYDYFIPAAQHQNQKLLELGATQDYIIQALASMTGQTQQEIVDLLSEASATAIEDDVEYYTEAEVYAPDKVNTEALHAQLNSGLLQTQEAFFNITRTTANTASKQFERALDRAWTQINTGGMDYITAIKRAITDLSNDGIGAIEYSSGRIDNIEVAVRRAVVTGANQTAMKTQEVLADELEVELVEVTAHGGARPDHAKWQGKVFGRHGRVTIDGVTYKGLKEATGYGSGAGLGGWNCRHNFHPYIPGTTRTWSDKQLKDLDAKKIEYNGEKYTEYEASQIQRKIERNIRKVKRTVQALEAAGLDASAERKVLRDSQKSYTDFTKQTGIKKQSARTQIGELAVAKNATTTSNDKLLTNNVNSGTISSGNLPTKHYTKVNVADIPPMDKKKFTKMKDNLEKQGVAVIQDAEGDRFLARMGAEALTLSDGSGVIFQSGRVPSASAMYEEVIHVSQIRKNGTVDSTGGKQSTLEYLRREIEANEKLLKNQSAYKLTEKDIESVQENLEFYYKRLEEVSQDV